MECHYLKFKVFDRSKLDIQMIYPLAQRAWAFIYEGEKKSHPIFSASKYTNKQSSPRSFLHLTMLHYTKE